MPTWGLDASRTAHFFSVASAKPRLAEAQEVAHENLKKDMSAFRSARVVDAKPRSAEAHEATPEKKVAFPQT